MSRSVVTCLTMVLLGLAQATAAGAQTSGTASSCPPRLAARTTVLPQKGVISGATWVGLNETATVVIDGVCLWTAEHPATGPHELRLIIAGHILEQSVPTVINLAEDYIKFDLKLDPATNRAQWVKILSAVRDSPDHRVNISVGHPATHDVFASNTFITFKLYPSYTRYVLIGLLALLGLLIYLAKGSNLLRDTDGAPPNMVAPFSLGHVQMAWWFYLVVASYLYIWLVTGEYNTVTDAVITLIGISAATGLGAVFVGGQKRGSLLSQRAALTSEITALQARVAEIAQANPVPDSSLDVELQSKKAQLTKAQANLAVLPFMPPPTASKGFWLDIISDGSGVKFHRFQVVVWMAVLGVVFVRLVYYDFAMPEFSTTLLGLMGISSGTYLGFKFPEASK